MKKLEEGGIILETGHRAKKGKARLEREAYQNSHDLFWYLELGSKLFFIGFSETDHRFVQIM